jgi:hypothetical protein
MARKSAAPKTADRRRTPRKRRTSANGNGKKIDAKTLHTLLTLQRNVKRFSPIVRKRLLAAGVKANPAFIYSAAMYYETLDRLAKE